LAWPGGHFAAGVSWNTGTGTTAQPASRTLVASALIISFFNFLSLQNILKNKGSHDDCRMVA
jgi:hypothetical protein